MLIQLHKDLTKPMLGFGGSEVLIGRDGRMFYLGGEMVRQSAGLIVRDQKVADSANLLAGMRDALAKRGIAFFVVVLPSTSSIYEGDLPLWAQNRRSENRIRFLSAGPCRAWDKDCRSAVYAEKDRVRRQGLSPAQLTLDRARRRRRLRCDCRSRILIPTGGSIRPRAVGPPQEVQKRREATLPACSASRTK